MDAKHFPRSRLLPFLEELERRDTPTFAALPPFTAGVSFPTVVASADFNGDGIVDVAVGNSGKNAASSPSIGIALGVGDGTFKALAFLADAKLARPQSLIVADLNGDGIQDLAVGSSTSNVSMAFGSLLVFLGKGDGSFNPATAVDVSPTIAVGVADFNKDGIPDLVQVTPEAGSSSAGFQLYQGAGNGSFAKLGAFQFFLLGVSRVATADFDKDGFQDFAALDSQDNQLFTFFGDGAGNFTIPGQGSYALGGRPTDIVAGDFNGDGLTDLVVAQDTQIVFIGNLGARFMPPFSRSNLVANCANISSATSGEKGASESVRPNRTESETLSSLANPSAESCNCWRFSVNAASRSDRRDRSSSSAAALRRMPARSRA